MQNLESTIRQQVATTAVTLTMSWKKMRVFFFFVITQTISNKYGYYDVNNRVPIGFTIWPVFMNKMSSHAIDRRNAR